jgi:hypothetical protein
MRKMDLRAVRRHALATNRLHMRWTRIHSLAHDASLNQGWVGEVAAIETTMAAAAQKLKTMRGLTARSTTLHLGMPDVRHAAGRSTPEA